MRALAALLLLGTALGGGAGAPLDTASADASEQAARSRLDAERAEIEHRVDPAARMIFGDCPGGRNARFEALREPDGTVRRLFLQRATTGTPEASSIWAYYDRGGELFYATLYRRSAASFARVRMYVGGGVPYFREFSGSEGLTTDVPSPRLLAALTQPERLVARGIPCGDGPLW